MRLKLLLVALGAAFCILVCVLVSLPGISSSTEARELEVIKTIYTSGEWLLPLRNGMIPSKPPLFHWLGAIAAHLQGGVSALSGRAVSVLAGCLTLLITALGVMQIFAGARAKAYAFSSYSMLVLTFGFTALMTEARVDMLSCLFIVAAMLALLHGVRAHNRSSFCPTQLDYALFWAACACGILARGPLGTALPLLLAGSCLAYLRGPKFALFALLKPRLVWLFPLFAVCWYGLAFREGGEAFLGRQIVFENLQRLVGGEHVNTKPWWFYLPDFLRLCFPWSVLFLYFSARWLRELRREDFVHSAVHLRGIFVVWFWVGFAFFSAASGKRPSYLLPLCAPMAILVGVGVVDAYYCSQDLWRERLHHLVRALKLWPLFVVAVLLIEYARFPLFGSSSVAAELQSFLSTQLTTLQLSLLSLLLIGWLCHFVEHAAFARYSLVATLLGATILLALSMGQTIKARLQGHDITAAHIDAAVAGPELIVLKAPWDERFDVVSYYSKKSVHYSDLGSNQVGCGGDLKLCENYLLTSADLFYEVAKETRLRGGSLQLLGKFTNWRRKEDPRLDQQMILFRLLGAPS